LNPKSQQVIQSIKTLGLQPSFL